MMIQNKFGRKARARLKTKEIGFSTKGVLKFYTRITNDEGVEIGQITYNLLNSTARIFYDDKIVDLKNYNFWNSKWELTDHNGTIIKYNGSSEKGIIETTHHDEKLILSGLYVANVFWQTRIGMGLVILAALWVNFILIIQ